MYRDDYARGSIRMLPVVEPDGRSTSLRMLLYSLMLLPVSLAPAFLGMTGRIYLSGALVLGLLFIFFSARMIFADLAVTPQSRTYARQVFRCSVVYLPLLFVLMMSNSLRG
jgi:protoheme IX farnesyltransferase